MRGASASVSRDDGMTLLEVMIAAVILFIVLTGVLSLIMQTLNMGRQSKEMAVFNNVVNSYIERVQAMPFDKVVVGGGPGELTSVETTVAGEYTITITPIVTAGSTADLKKLVVNATITDAAGNVRTTSTDVVIRDKTNFLTKGVTGPVVTWTTASMPAEGEVVWGSTKASGGALWIAAEATAAEGLTISRVAITADNGWALQSTGGDDAIWDVDFEDREQSWSLTGFAWNTLQRGIINAETLEEGYVIPDGLRTITIDVTDSDGGNSERTYTLLVDNHAPAKPGMPGMELRTVGPVVTWAHASDGTDPAGTYRLSLIRRAPDGIMVWEPQPPVDVTSNVYSLDPFSRYVASVKAIGVPPNNRESEAAAQETSFITPPRATGTWDTASNGSGKATMSVSAPTFRILDTPVYSWRSSSSPNGPWTTVVGTAASLTNVSYSGTVYYRCFVTLTPGYDYTAVPTPKTTFASSVIGPTGGKKTSGTFQEQWLP